jgi:hypothetical protein
LAKKLEVKAVIRAVDKATGPIRLAARRIKTSLGGALRGIGGTIGRLTSGVGGLIGKLGLLGGAGLVGGATAWVKSYVEAGSELAKFSRQVGLSAQSVQELEYIAGLSDISVGELRGGLRKLTKNVGEARAGTGQLVSSLRYLDRGLLKQIQSSKGMGEAVDLVMSAMARETDAAKRAAIANAAFGRAGTKLVTMAEQGEEGLRKMAQEARNSGAIMGGKTLKQTEDFNDSIHRMKMRFRAVTHSIMAGLLPILGPLVKKFTAWMALEKNQRAVADAVKSFVQAIIDGVPKMVEFGRQVAATFKELGGLKTIGIALAAVFGVKLLVALGPVGAALAGIVAGAIAAIAAIKEVIAANDELDKRETVVQSDEDLNQFQGRVFNKTKKDAENMELISNLSKFTGAKGLGFEQVDAGLLFAEAARRTAMATTAKGGKRDAVDVNVKVSATGGATVDKTSAKATAGASLKVDTGARGQRRRASR